MEEINMRRFLPTSFVFFFGGIAAVFILAFSCPLAAPDHVYYPLVAHGTYVDVTNNTVYARDFAVNPTVPHVVEMSMYDSLTWEESWPITCEDIGVQVVRLRQPGAGSFVETFVVIQDNTGICPEYGP
jgi:hypothetical protein